MLTLKRTYGDYGWIRTARVPFNARHNTNLNLEELRETTVFGNKLVAAFQLEVLSNGC